MSIVRYIKDCVHFAKRFPCKDGYKGTWIRNVLYCNAQPKYWHGRLISRLFERKLAK